jgi:HK97 family phage portal protein
MAIETLRDMVLMRGGYDMTASERRSNTLADPDHWLLDAFGARPTHSGEVVTPGDAQNFGAVQAAWRFLTETEASLPCHLYRRRPEGRGKDRADDHYLYTLLHDSPNREMTAFEFWQYMRQNRAGWGNAFALPTWYSTGKWREIWPLRPDLMSVKRTADGKVYDYDNGDAGSDMGGVKLSGHHLAKEIIHVRGMGDDLLGWSPIRLVREGLGTGLSAQKAAASFYKNGARMSGVLQFSGKLPKGGPNGEPSQEEESFQKKYAGAHNTGKVLMIGGDSKFVSTTIPPEDAQYLSTIKATRDEIWAIYGIPPHLMGDTEKSTSFGAGIEQQVLGYLKFTGRASLEMSQQRFEMILLGRNERDLFIEFDMLAFLQADAKTQAEVLGIERQNGIINADDWRAIKNYNPIGGEEGGAYLVNGTMIPVTVALQKTAAPAAPTTQQ